jgi:DNA-binding NarL/FixJ family response regulator
VALTPRQTEILRLVAAGLTSTEIAHRVRLSEVTVKWHVKNAMERLGAASRAEAVAIALRKRLL